MGPAATARAASEGKRTPGSGAAARPGSDAPRPPPVRLVAWDLDGVLTQVPSIWDHLLHALGRGEECEENKRRYFAGELGYRRWAELDAALMAGTSRERLDELASAIPLTPGVRDALRAVREAGASSLVISSGLDVLGERVGRELGVPCISNHLRWRGGRVAGVEVVVSLENKGELLRAALAERGLGPERCAVVGDGASDLPMFRLARHPIAFGEAAREVVAAALYRARDMRELAALLGRLCRGGAGPAEGAPRGEL